MRCNTRPPSAPLAEAAIVLGRLARKRHLLLDWASREVREAPGEVNAWRLLSLPGEAVRTFQKADKTSANPTACFANATAACYRLLGPTDAPRGYMTYAFERLGAAVAFNSFSRFSNSSFISRRGLSIIRSSLARVTEPIET
jgi:hypothetical protein